MCCREELSSRVFSFEGGKDNARYIQEGEGEYGG